jgi:hypothetical protein
MDTSLDRRDAIAALAAFAAGLALPAAAADRSGSGNRIWSPGGLPHDLPPGALQRPRARVPRKPPFNLDDPMGRSLARLRVLQNFEGKTSYLAVLSRWLLCVPNKPPVPYLNEVELNTIFLTEPESKAAGKDDELSFTQNAIFTRMPVDPVTLTPIQQVRNPVTGGMVDTPDTLFASSSQLKVGAPGVADVLLQPDRPHFRVGRDIRFVMLDIRAGEGAYQPRVDTATWSIPYEILMDPRRAVVDADYSYTALLRASVFASTGVAADDPTQLLILKTGIKVNSVDALPDFTKSTIVKSYPERLAAI